MGSGYGAKLVVDDSCGADVKIMAEGETKLTWGN